MPKRPLYESHSDSDSSDDEELFHATFESHGVQTKKPSASLLKPPSNNKTSNATCTQKKSIQARAQERANAKMLPAGITCVENLVWYRQDSDEESTPILYFPCRICESSEATMIGVKPNSWNLEEVVLVQALVDTAPFQNGKRDRMLVNRSSLLPYNGDDNTTTTTTTDEWCPTLWNLYEAQVKRLARETYKTIDEQELLSTKYYLQRILEHAQEQEEDATLSSSSDEQQYDDNTNSQASMASDEMQEPYAEDYGLDVGNDDYVDEHMFDDDKQTEPLRPGDVIEYTLPIFRHGDKRGLRTTRVLATRPDDNPLLVLENGDVLPNDTYVKRVQVVERGILHKHPNGYCRLLSNFKLAKSGTATLRDGLKAEGERVDKIMNKNLSKFEKQAQENGFAPMDVFHKRHKNKNSSEMETTSSRDGGGGASSNNNNKRTKQQRQRPEKREQQHDFDSSDSDSNDGVQVQKPSKKKNRRNTTQRKSRIADEDSSDSDSSMEVLVQSTKRAANKRTKMAASDSSSSDSDSDDSLSKKPARNETRKLLSKTKTRGMQAFDSDDGKDDDNDDIVVTTMRAASRGGAAAKKPATKKKKPPSSKPAVTKKKPSAKPVAKKSSTKGDGSSNKATRLKVERNTILVKPGEWVSTRRTNVRESLGIDSDVTSLASLPSNDRDCRSNQSTANKSTGEKTASSFPQSMEDNDVGQDYQDEGIVQVQDRNQTKKRVKRKASKAALDNDDSDEEVSASPKPKRRRRVASSKSVGNNVQRESSLATPSNGRSVTRKARKPSPMSSLGAHNNDENVVDLSSSPPRKEKPKRASYGSRGKSRVELGRSLKKRNKISVRPDTLSFHSSSEEDESSVDMTKYNRKDYANQDSVTGTKKAVNARGGVIRNAPMEVDSDSSDDESDDAPPPKARRAAVGMNKSPVLDLTGNDSDVDSSNAENPAPAIRKRGGSKRPQAQHGKTSTTKDAPAADKKPSTFGLSLSKHNVRKSKKSKQRPALASKNTLKPPLPAGGKRIYETQDSSDSDTESARKKRSAALGDWGSYRPPDSQSTNGTNANVTRDFDAPVAKHTFRLGSQSTGSSVGRSVEKSSNPFAKTQGDDDLVDSSSDDDLDSDSEHDLSPKKLFGSSRGKSETSRSSFALEGRVQVVKNRKRLRQR